MFIPDENEKRDDFDYLPNCDYKGVVAREIADGLCASGCEDNLSDGEKSAFIQVKKKSAVKVPRGIIAGIYIACLLTATVLGAFLIYSGAYIVAALVYLVFISAATFFTVFSCLNAKRAAKILKSAESGNLIAYRLPVSEKMWKDSVNNSRAYVLKCAGIVLTVNEEIYKNTAVGDSVLVILTHSDGKDYFLLMRT